MAMAKTKQNQSLEFANLLSRLAELGMHQNQIAEYLDISQAHLSRLKTGERTAPAKHIRALKRRLLEREKEISSPQRKVHVFSINNKVLGDLENANAVRAFRDLLWIRAASLSVPKTKINITDKINVADGGIDASVTGILSPTTDSLLENGTRFQIKTGEFKPWQREVIKKELFHNKKVSKSNLSHGIKRCLDDGGRYVLVCFGTDFVGEKRELAIDHLQKMLKSCDYTNARVEVWGQTQLTSLFHEYPSLCMRLLGYDQGGFQTHESWARNADMQPELHFGVEQQDLLNEIRENLWTGVVSHIRLIGEPGLGKTRLALEATRGEIAPAVLYFPNGEGFQQTTFINRLIQSDDSSFVVLVVDDCHPKDRASIWNLVQGWSKRVRLVTIDHGPELSAGDGMKVIAIPPTGKEQISKIIAGYGIQKREADRWAEECEGCPRVAHVIGDNLKHDRPDLFKSLATGDVWNRFINGHDDPTSSEARLRQVVLRYISLFERFGFESPVTNEAEYIASLAQKHDPQLTWHKFQEIVYQLKQRRILQGSRTLFLTPRFLHRYLYREYWNNHGRSENLSNLLGTMPQDLRRWFVEMLRYAHLSPNAEQAVNRLLEDATLFASEQFADTEQNGRLLMSLAETNPKPTLATLQRILIRYDETQLQNLKKSRQYFVWALERIAVRDELFSGAAELLLALAAAENAEHSNNATGTFKDLFCLVPGMAVTQATPARRLAVLRKALESDTSKKRKLGLLGCGAALETRGSGRMVGPEYQGFRKVLEPWMPKTYGELWQAHRDVWDLLVEKLRVWQGEDLRNLIDVLIQSAWCSVDIPTLALTVLETLEGLATHPFTNVGTLAEFVKRYLRFTDEGRTEEVTKRLRSLCDRLDGHDFPSKLQRFVKHASWEDSYDERHERSDFLDQKINELVQATVDEPSLLKDELPWLVCENSNPAFHFAHRLAKSDKAGRLFDDLIKHQKEQGTNAGTSFLSGYLWHLFSENPSRWESAIHRLAGEPIISARLSDFVISSGMSDNAAEKVIEMCRAGTQNVQCFEKWWFSDRIRPLSETTFAKLIKLQLEDRTRSMWSNAVNMYHTYYLERNNVREVPEQLTFELLTNEGMTNERQAHAAGYQWSGLADVFLDQYSNRTWDFFKRIFQIGAKHWSVLADLDTNREQILSKIFKSDPIRAWECIAEIYNSSGDRLYGLTNWLIRGGHRLPGNESAGPIALVPTANLFAWVNRDVEDRRDWLASLLPKTFDQSQGGRLTRDFLAKYGDPHGCLRCRFHSRSWSGNESDYCRRQRDIARSWLSGERNDAVIGWIEDYIDGLSQDIERAEITEERGR